MIIAVENVEKYQLFQGITHYCVLNFFKSINYKG